MDLYPHRNTSNGGRRFHQKEKPHTGKCVSSMKNKATNANGNFINNTTARHKNNNAQMWLRKAFLNEERSFSLLANTGAAANQTSSSAKHFLAHDRDLFFVGWLFF